MIRPTCDCVKDLFDSEQKIISVWKMVNVCEVTDKYAIRKYVHLPLMFCPACGKQYQEVGDDK